VIKGLDGVFVAAQVVILRRVRLHVHRRSTPNLIQKGLCARTGVVAGSAVPEFNLRFGQPHENLRVSDYAQVDAIVRVIPRPSAFIVLVFLPVGIVVLDRSELLALLDIAPSHLFLVSRSGLDELPVVELVADLEHRFSPSRIAILKLKHRVGMNRGVSPTKHPVLVLPAPVGSQGAVSEKLDLENRLGVVFRSFREIVEVIVNETVLARLDHGLEGGPRLFPGRLPLVDTDILEASQE